MGLNGRDKVSPIFVKLGTCENQSSCTRGLLVTLLHRFVKCNNLEPKQVKCNIIMLIKRLCLKENVETEYII